MARPTQRVKGLFRRPGSPHWWIRYADRHGHIRRESTGSLEEKLAKAVLEKRRTQVAENRQLDVKKVPNTTFYELCDEYWQTRGKHARMKGLASMIQAWKAGIGNVPLKELTSQKIEKYLNDRMEKEGLSPATRNRHLTMLRAMFNKAIQWELMAENPTSGIERMTETGARTRFLNQEKIKRLLDASSDTFRPILITALHTGMRHGKILQLRWQDVDLRNRIITVQKSKSGKKRTIPVDDTLAETLNALRS